MNETILLIEDDPLSQRLMRDLLEAVGFRVLAFANAEEGLECLAIESPAIVLLDIRLPGINGFDALKAIRTMPAMAEVPTVAVTASVMLDERKSILEAGFDAYHAKPIQIQALLSEIKSLIASSKGKRP
jgi:CheY-like chemotaxis protein